VTRDSDLLACGGCGWRPAADDPYPFRCPNVGSDDADHIIVPSTKQDLGWPNGDEPNPFVRYRSLLHSYRLGRARGMTDDAYVALVERLDKEVAAVDGRGFAVTPFGRADRLSDRLGFDPAGGVWVKDETGNVSGSHKARHLFGVLLHLAVVADTGMVEPGERPDLAIASCGNAALAAAVVARAADRRIRVFVPTWADAGVVDRLRSLGADVDVCERAPGVPGDPTYLALQRAIANGALPFTCQGNENGLAIEGGQTLGFELVSAVAHPRGHLDRVFVQVGGGALASAVIAAFRTQAAVGAVPDLPAFHAVQTAGGHPLKRAYERVVDRVATRLGTGRPDDLRERFQSTVVQEALGYARHHRSEFMWPWEEEPKSVAHGILDDETYDWFAVVVGMLASGGWPVVVEEETLERANDLGRSATGIDADHTGTSGLAGLMSLREQGEIGSGERVAVLFTGARR